MSNYSFKKASMVEISQIWEVIKGAIQRRKAEGSEQWQNGYPNLEVLQHDIERGVGYVLTTGATIIGYAAVMLNDEPEYLNIRGKWLTETDFVVFHRLAIAQNYIGKGLAQKIFEFIEEFARANAIYSVKADTNFDNMAMLKIFEKMGYKYCGEVYFRGSARKAFEKVLSNPNLK